MRHAARRDANELEIVRSLRAAGALVWRLDERDLPDLLCGWRGRWVLLEVKSAKGRLSAGQTSFMLVARAFGLPVHEVRTSEQALRAIGAEIVERRP